MLNKQHNESDAAVIDAEVKKETRFLQLFCVLFVCMGAIVFTFKRTDLFPWIGACNAAAYDNDTYLAYCHNTRYGDYEHYALYNGTEPRAVAALKQAQVLFLGNSNTQFAFSTNAVRDYFEKSGVSHYVMGFGNGAQSPVAKAIIEKHGLTPQIVVANIDPFFSNETNGTFQRVLSDAETLVTEFKRKKQLQQWQANVCTNESSIWYEFLCHGSAETLFRSRTNGHWVTDYYRKNYQHPVTESDDLLDTLESAEGAANAFIAAANLRRDCVVLTVSPRTDTPTAFAQNLASRLNLPLLIPELEGLVTIDHSHLDKLSAQRWSAAFLHEFDGVMQHCINPTAEFASTVTD